jgi:hypothetical protein
MTPYARLDRVQRRKSLSAHFAFEGQGVDDGVFGLDFKDKFCLKPSPHTCRASCLCVFDDASSLRANLKTPFDKIRKRKVPVLGVPS